MEHSWRSIVLFCSVTLLLIKIALAQPGFLSLDCGGDEEFTDPDTGIHWVPDGKYITTGLAAVVSSEVLALNYSKQFQTLRYFPDKSKKHCYSLPVEPGGTYILRPGFTYGNYDRRLRTQNSVFVDFIVGANYLFTANAYNWYYEFIVRLASRSDNTLSVCVASNSTSSIDVPFISNLELRRLSDGMYGLEENQALHVYRRLNLAAPSKKNIRYPDDEYDRIWASDKNFGTFLGSDYPNITTNSEVSVGKTRNKPPSAVMRSAIFSNSSILFEFPSTTLDEASLWSYAFYFAELAKLNKTRSFGIGEINNLSSVSILTVSFDMGKVPLTSTEYVASTPEYLSPTAKFAFLSTDNSSTSPGVILNAAEIFRFISPLHPGTDPDDVSAIVNIKSYFNLSGWSGDPCFPKEYSWSWITCSTSSATIIGLKLSNMKLGGFIPQSLTQLTHLEEIYLDNNSFRGSVPDLSSLQNLTILNLQNNNLTEVCLRQKPGLSLNITGNPASASCTSSTSLSSKSKNSTGIIVGVTVPCVAVLVILAAMFLFFKNRKKQPRTTTTVPVEASPSSTGNVKAKRFTYKEIVEATNSFRTKIGEGGFGPVYRGCLPNGQEVAVKVHSGDSHQGLQEFNTEIDILSLVHHKNLVDFVGFCSHESKLILVYEFLSNGTLRDHLHGSRRSHLNWKRRLGIGLEAAQGLDYLHTGCKLGIIHRDIKSTNILLTSTKVAKIADFGISKLYDKEKGTHISTTVKGTLGYLDPEYHVTNRLTEKSDVFSFGVVLLELVTGREPIDRTLPEGEVSMVQWVRRELSKGNLVGVVDPTLTTYNDQAAWKMLEVAMMCTEYNSVDRPNMSVVVNELKEAIDLDS